MVAGAQVHLPYHVTFLFLVELDHAARTHPSFHQSDPRSRRSNLFVRRKSPVGRGYLPAEPQDPAAEPVQQAAVRAESLPPVRARRPREPLRLSLPEKTPLALPPDLEVVSAALHSLLPKSLQNTETAHPKNRRRMGF